MKGYMIILFLVSFCFSQKKVPFDIDVKPRVIDGGKILVNVSVINNVGRQVDYLEGFLSQFSGENQFIDEKRMVILYSYEPPLKTGYSSYKSITYTLDTNKLSNFEFKVDELGSLLVSTDGLTLSLNDSRRLLK